MPHFSPLYWLLIGVVFYITLMLFLIMFWWFQNYNFHLLMFTYNSKEVKGWNWV